MKGIVAFAVKSAPNKPSIPLYIPGLNKVNIYIEKVAIKLIIVSVSEKMNFLHIAIY
jgi:hypothetical protein